jgi:hypothetical protein
MLRYLPIAVAAVVLLLATGAFAVFNRPTTPPAGGGTPVPNAGLNLGGDVAATVNGKPITKAAWQERLQVAKEDYTDQFGLNFDNTETGQRMADVLSFDVLDQMINFEVLMQEAQKDAIIPNPTQVQQRYGEIQTATAKTNQTWEQFLQQQKMTDAQFRQNIVEAFTYLIMADKHSGAAGGSEEQRQAAFGAYICDTRKRYDVKLFVQFIVPQEPCSSAGVMPGQPAPNITVPPRTPVPNPVETGEPPQVAPPAAAPTATGAK